MNLNHCEVFRLRSIKWTEWLHTLDTQQFTEEEEQEEVPPGDMIKRFLFSRATEEDECISINTLAQEATTPTATATTSTTF